MNSLRHSFGLNAFAFAGLIGLFALTPSSSRAQLSLTADYSSLGSVYQDATGAFFNSAGAGRTDVTTLVKSDISAAFDYFTHSLLPPAGTWSEQINFSLFDFGNAGTVGDSGIDTIDANGRPATSSIRFNLDTGIQYFVDPTPFDNSEFNISFGNAALGGGMVNNKRFGDAFVGGPADGRWDLMTLILHETEHSLGISNGQSSGFTKFLDLVGPVGNAGDPDRELLIPSTLSGLPSDFNMDVVPDSSHFDGAPVGNSTFGYMTTADPGWQTGQRALPTALDFLAVARVEGLTASQLDTSLFVPASVPEPGSVAVFMIGSSVAAASFASRKRRKSRLA